ncbi:nuclear transport factor 2 family protein [Galbibacter sp. BG1]
MNTETAVTEIISLHAKYLNEGSFSKLKELYSKQIIFTPDHYKTLYYDQIISHKKNIDLKKQGFTISYTIDDVVVDHDYAFVLASATIKIMEDENLYQQKSKDHFVLKKENNNWKLFRQSFNNTYKNSL